jgi:UDP-4-amino-4,6-dideoxy-N-acetyl-beta-L-altrosamine transaminase
MIPYGIQDITEDDIKEVVKVLRSDFITQGQSVPIFEQKLCNYTGAEYSVVVNSCTSALHIACLALNLGPGDILWTSPITFVASANCALYCGATVDFVDIESDTAMMSVEKLKEKLEWADKKGKLPKIVIPVHFAGQPCDMKEIYALSQQYKFKIIEDAAHAIGAEYQNERVGSCQYSDITVFSFHPVKIITTGEGGAAMTNSILLADKMKILRSHGITRDLGKMHKKHSSLWYYEQIELGFNYRMTDMQAELGSSQLNRLDQYVLRRSDISEYYNEQLKDLAIVSLIQKSNRRSANHLYVIKFENNSHNRDEIYTSLYENGIGVNLHYIPVYRQPYYESKFDQNWLENAEDYYKNAITIPLFPGMSFQQADFIIDKLHDFCSI